MSIQNFKFVLNSSFIATMSLLSVRSNEKFHHGGYMYVFDKYTKDRQKKMWRCEWKNRGCKARLHSYSETTEVISIKGAHIHPSNAARVEVTRAITEMKNQAVASQEGIAQVINRSLQQMPVAVQGQMPNLRALKQSIRRKRVQAYRPPPNPASLAELVMSYPNRASIVSTSLNLEVSKTFFLPKISLAKITL